MYPKRVSDFSSSQFEMAIGTAMVLFGIGSKAAMATVVGPLLEIPFMVTAAKLLWRTTGRSQLAGGTQPARETSVTWARVERGE